MIRSEVFLPDGLWMVINCYIHWHLVLNDGTENISLSYLNCNSALSRSPTGLFNPLTCTAKLPNEISQEFFSRLIPLQKILESVRKMSKKFTWQPPGWNLVRLPQGRLARSRVEKSERCVFHLFHTFFLVDRFFRLFSSWVRIETYFFMKPKHWKNIKFWRNCGKYTQYSLTLSSTQKFVGKVLHSHRYIMKLFNFW